VLVEHRHVVLLFEVTQQWFRFCEHDVWTMFYSVAFDFSVWELVGTGGPAGTASASRRPAAAVLSLRRAGSDLAGLTSTVHEESDHFVLDGTKSMVSNGSSADFFVVDADSPGMTIDRTEPLGWRAADPATVRTAHLATSTAPRLPGPSAMRGWPPSAGPSEVMRDIIARLEIDEATNVPT
jgi:hypothetical protein